MGSLSSGALLQALRGACRNRPDAVGDLIAVSATAAAPAGDPEPHTPGAMEAPEANTKPTRNYLASCIRNADSVPASHALRAVRRWQASIVLPCLQEMARLVHALAGEPDAARALLAVVDAEGVVPAKGSDYWVHAPRATAALASALDGARHAAEDCGGQPEYSGLLTTLAAEDEQGLRAVAVAWLHRRPDIALDVARELHRQASDPFNEYLPPPLPTLSVPREAMRLSLLAATRGRRPERPGQGTHALRAACVVPAVQRLVATCSFLAGQGEAEMACPLLQAVCGAVTTLRSTSFWAYFDSAPLLRDLADARAQLPLRLQARVPNPRASDQLRDPWASSAASMHR